MRDRAIMEHLLLKAREALIESAKRRRSVTRIHEAIARLEKGANLLGIDLTGEPNGKAKAQELYRRRHAPLSEAAPTSPAGDDRGTDAEGPRTR